MAERGRRASDQGLELLARFGFLARGAVYLVVGVLAARVAFLSRGRATGPSGALQKILQGWNGRFALGVVAAGLFSFVFYRAVQAARAKTRLKQIGHAVGAIGILILAVSAVELILRLRMGPDGVPLRAWGGWLLARSWGRALLVLGGVVAVVAGGVEVVRAAIDKLPNDFAAAVVARENRTWISRLARFGVFAHGIVIGTVGLSVLRAGIDTNPRELVGTAGALRSLKSPAPVFFAFVAVGLIAYGISLTVLAAHKRRHLR